MQEKEKVQIIYNKVSSKKNVYYRQIQHGLASLIFFSLNQTDLQNILI